MCASVVIDIERDVLELGCLRGEGGEECIVLLFRGVGARHVGDSTMIKI